MAEKPSSLRMVGPADYGLRAGRVGVLERERQRRLSALTRLARSIGAAQHGHGSCIRPVGRKLTAKKYTGAKESPPMACTMCRDVPAFVFDPGDHYPCPPDPLRVRGREACFYAPGVG